MNKTPVSMWEENMKALHQERVLSIPARIMVEQAKRAHEFALATASAPVINITVRRYD